MGLITLELPDALEHRAKTYGVDIAAVAVAAVTDEVDLAEGLAMTPAELLAVVWRLQGHAAEDVARLAQAYEDGASWAKEQASLAELVDLAKRGEVGDAHPVWLTHRAVELGLAEALYRQEYGRGALDVWEAVEPLIF